MEHTFIGKWITNSEFANLKPRNVFHKQLDKIDLPCDEHRNRHILFRRKFVCDSFTKNATLYISADDYYKLYINGRFVAQGPAPSYHFKYNYNAIDISKYLQKGENLIAVHTLYQGLINRVWQSGDNRHGLILDLVIDGETVVTSDESFKTKQHNAYTEMGICGYQTQFLERYDSNATEVGFALHAFVSDSEGSTGIGMIVKYILDNRCTVTLDDLAAKFGYSKNYLCRLLMKLTGKSFLQILNSARIETAESMLSTTDMRMEKVAVNAGFSSVKQFYRVFRQYHDTTPTAWREKKRIKTSEISEVNPKV